MRPIDELTMYAYGLLDAGEESGLRAHVESCSDCTAQVECLREEKRLLERAAWREPAQGIREAVDRAIAPHPPRRRSLVPFALAAVFLAGLAGLLVYRPAPPEVPGDVGRKVSTDAVERLVAELRSPIPLRREIAVAALTAYGEAAAPAIRKAKVEESLFPGVRWREQDPKVLEILRTTKMELSFENDRVDALLQAIGEKLRLSIVVDAKGDPRWDPAKTITFKVKDLTALNALKLLASQFGLSVFAEDGKVLLSFGRPPGPARAPIRIGNRSASAATLVRALESLFEDDRRGAERELERLNFAAELDLWAGLEAPFEHARQICARLLRRLYDERQTWTPPSSSHAVKAVLREKRITTGLENAQLPFVIDFWREMAKLEVHIVGVADPDEVAISLKGENLTLFEALTLALEPHGLGFEVRETILVITPKHQISAPRHNAPLWSPAAESARIEALLEALSSRDPAARRKAEQDFLGLGEASLEALGEAARLLDLPQASQARALRERILEERKLWLLDSGSGARAQALTDGQKRLLEGKVTCSVRAVQAGEFLASTAKTLGVKLDVRTAPPRAVTLTLQEVPLGALLRALTLPHGLDFYLDGDTIVVDTAANVRAAVEK